MADVADIGNEQADYLLGAALQRHHQRRAGVATTSAEFCEGCGVDIPEARRIAVRGCQRCVDCQGHAEREGRL